MSDNDVPASEHRRLTMRLDALRATVPEADVAVFDNAVNDFLIGYDISAIGGRFLLIFALDKLNVRHISTSGLVDLLT